ncbi:MAG: hypothetical protein U9Q07_10120, partial [Planctomycetota bacterium]|nr:hypothetical protein [Planctomycetota bacterium]
EQLNSFPQSWWSWMWPMFWQVSALVVFIGAIDLLLRRRVWPQVRYAFWLLVLVKLVLPPTFALSTSIVTGDIQKSGNCTTRPGQAQNTSCSGN